MQCQTDDHPQQVPFHRASAWYRLDLHDCTYFAEPLSSIMTIRRTLYPGFQDALCPVQPPASLEWLGIFDSEGFPGRKSVRLVRPRILPSNYRRVAAI